MFKKRQSYSRKLKEKRDKAYQGMRDDKEANRLKSASPHYLDLPDLRRRIVIIDYDFGLVVHKIDLYKTDRIDCFDMFVDGEPRHSRIGFSKILEKIRLNFPRIGSFK